MMHKKRVKNVNYLATTRKELRNNGTPAEASLWDMLKNKQLEGRKFRRQASIEHYIVDFFCPSERLIIELDGAVHNHPAVAENDRYRDEWFTSMGYMVLRFENKEVFNMPEHVLDEIRRCFQRE